MKLSSVEKSEMCEAYAAGKTTVQLGARYRCATGSVWRILRKMGVQTRRTGNQRKYTVNTSAFDTLNEGAAYWAGFLMADGSITYEDRKRGDANTEYAIDVALQSGDESHVRAFGDFVGSNAPIVRRKQAMGDFSASRILVYSRELVLRLVAMGVTPDKGTWGQPADEVRFNRHYWRGVIDGDGSIGLTRRRGRPEPWFRLVGSEPLVQAFAEFVRSVHPSCDAQARLLRGRPLWHICLGSRALLAVVRTLYKDSTVALPRKKARAAEILSLYPNGVIVTDKPGWPSRLRHRVPENPPPIP